MSHKTNLAVLQKNLQNWSCGSSSKTQPGDNPGDGKEDENGVAGFLVARVPEHLGQLEQVVGAVVDD